MRPIAKLIAAMCLLITGIVVSGAAAAHGSVHFGVVVGGPVWWGGKAGGRKAVTGLRHAVDAALKYSNTPGRTKSWD